MYDKWYCPNKKKKDKSILEGARELIINIGACVKFIDSVTISQKKNNGQ